MNNISSITTKLLASWRYFKPAVVFRFTSTGANLSDNFEPDFEDKFNEKREKCANEVRLLGRVGMDAAVVTKEGKSFARFSLATNSYWKSDGDDQEKTDWHTIMVFEPNLVNAAGKYIKKGNRLYSIVCGLKCAATVVGKTQVPHVVEEMRQILLHMWKTRQKMFNRK